MVDCSNCQTQSKSGVLFGLLTLKMYLFARLCHVRTIEMIPFLSFFFYDQNAVIMLYSAIIGVKSIKKCTRIFG